MKKIFAIALALAVAYFVVITYGDDTTKGAANDAVDGAKDAADKAGDKVNPETAVDVAEKGADTIAGLPEVVWTTVLPVALAVGAGVWIWKDPKRRALAFGVLALCLAVALISNVS